MVRIYDAPPFVHVFADYIIQQILKIPAPLYHIIYLNPKLRRNDPSKNPKDLIQKVLRDSIEIKEEHEVDFKKPPKYHTILFYISQPIPSENIGIIYNRFSYIEKRSIIPLIQEPYTCEHTEIYKTKIHRNQKRKQEDDDSPRINNVVKAYQKKNTIIYEIINQFRINDFNPIDIKEHFPSINISNFTVWSKRHAKYKVLVKKNNHYVLEPSVMKVFQDHFKNISNNGNDD